MTDKELDEKFMEAVEKASDPKLEFPPDVRLYFYAYYKRALGNHEPNYKEQSDERSALVSGFKMNALFQVKNISVKQAKLNYIELVEKYVP